jgi:hypothetical protein
VTQRRAKPPVGPFANLTPDELAEKILGGDGVFGYVRRQVRGWEDDCRPADDPPKPLLPPHALKQALEDIEKLHDLVNNTFGRILKPLHRLARVDAKTIDDLIKETENEFVRGLPSMYCVRPNGDIRLWPRQEDDVLPELYVE